jgi:AraC family transcriptional regulator
MTSPNDELLFDGIHVAEVHHRPAEALDAHVHDTTNLCVLLDGGATERRGSEIQIPTAMTVIGRRADTPHANHSHALGARWLVVDLDPQDRCVRSATAIETGASHELALALVSAFRSSRAERRRRVHAAVGHILESMQAPPPPIPRWLELAREILVDRLACPPTIEQLARVVGVHPVHLAQMFQRRFGITPKRFVRAHQVFLAIDAVGRGSSLAEAAHAAGFADQSHMTRVVHRERGAPPGALRGLAP